MKTTWTAERERQLREWTAEGLTEKQIGNRLGVCAGTVFLARQRLGIKVPPQFKRQRYHQRLRDRKRQSSRSTNVDLLYGSINIDDELPR